MEKEEDDRTPRPCRSVQNHGSTGSRRVPCHSLDEHPISTGLHLKRLRTNPTTPTSLLLPLLLKTCVHRVVEGSKDFGARAMINTFTFRMTEGSIDFIYKGLGPSLSMNNCFQHCCWTTVGASQSSFPRPSCISFSMHRLWLVPLAPAMGRSSSLQRFSNTLCKHLRHTASKYEAVGD